MVVGTYDSHLSIKMHIKNVFIPLSLLSLSICRLSYESVYHKICNICQKRLLWWDANCFCISLSYEVISTLLILLTYVGQRLLKTKFLDSVNVLFTFSLVCWQISWTWLQKKRKGGLSIWLEMQDWMPRLIPN